MAKPRELFQPVPLEDTERKPVRPADSLSNFVVEELPTLLKDIREKRVETSVLVERAETLAAAISLKVNFLSDQGKDAELQLVRLDVLMLQAAIFHARSDEDLKADGQVAAVPGESLSNLVAKIAQLTGRPAALTYEDVVIHNPPQDIRTFSNGLVGRSEADFYLGHSYIEAVLEPSVQRLNLVLANSELMTTEQIIEQLGFVIESMNVNTGYTGTIDKKMPTDHFKGYFRQYLGKLPNGLPGASGAFSPRVPLIEHLLMGETIPQSGQDYIREKIQYYPLAHQKPLLMSLENANAGQSVRQILIRRGSPEAGIAALKKASDIFKRFRTVHLHAVETHLPEEFEGKAPGTGGEENVPGFLNARLNYDHGFKDGDDNTGDEPKNE